MSENDKQIFDEFEEYLRQGEPTQRYRAESWKAAIGLQAVDGLTPSKYLIETARRHVAGEIAMDEVKSLIDGYYESRGVRDKVEHGVEEADKASANIARLLSEQTFSFSPAGYLALHKRIFDDILPFAGKMRNYNITKKEWVLRGDTVLYAGADELEQTLAYDFAQEKKFEYAGLSMAEMISHFARFIADLWQIHVFREGNTRTTAVFCIKYLRSMGFSADNEIFADNSWYFRNALVRANYRNYQKGIEPSIEFLERFFRNQLLGENNELRNRFLLVGLPDELKPNKNRTSTVQVPYKSDSTLEEHSGELFSASEETKKVISIIGENKLSVKEMLERANLKHRASFINLYLIPAVQSGFVALLYPEKPNHPRQKYFLTTKGFVVLREIDLHSM